MITFHYDHTNLKKEAGKCANLGYQEDMNGRDFGFGYDYDGVPLGLDPNTFRGLPYIRLFQPVGGYRRIACWHDF